MEKECPNCCSDYRPDGSCLCPPPRCSAFDLPEQTPAPSPVLQSAAAKYAGRVASEIQVGGSHYRSFAIQPAEFIHKNGIGFLAGNVIKYVCRHGAKNGVEDLQKARHYIDLLIEHEYGNNPTKEGTK